MKHEICLGFKNNSTSRSLFNICFFHSYFIREGLIDTNKSEYEIFSKRCIQICLALYKHFFVYGYTTDFTEPREDEFQDKIITLILGDELKFACCPITKPQYCIRVGYYENGNFIIVYRKIFYHFSDPKTSYSGDIILTLQDM